MGAELSRSLGLNIASIMEISSISFKLYLNINKFKTAETKSKILKSLKKSSLLQNHIATDLMPQKSYYPTKKKKADFIDENQELKVKTSRKTLKLSAYGNLDFTVYNWFQYDLKRVY